MSGRIGRSGGEKKKKNVVQVRRHPHSGIFGHRGACRGFAGGTRSLGPGQGASDDRLSEVAVTARTVLVDRRRAAGRAGERPDVVQIRQKSRRHFNMGGSVTQHCLNYIFCPTIGFMEPRIPVNVSCK